MKFLFYIAYLVCVSSLPISSLPERHLKPINQSLVGLSDDVESHIVLRGAECGKQVKQLGYYNPQGATDDLKKKDCQGGSSSDCPSSVEECASMVQDDDDCKSGVFMWSESYPVWGCRCCMDGKNIIPHNLWNLHATTTKEVVHDGECRKQLKRLGDFSSPGECAAKVGNDPTCVSDVFMWSESYPEWGCRCCQTSNNPIEHKLWNLYRETYPTYPTLPGYLHFAHDKWCNTGEQISWTDTDITSNEQCAETCTGECKFYLWSDNSGCDTCDTKKKTCATFKSCGITDDFQDGDSSNIFFKAPAGTNQFLYETKYNDKYCCSNKDNCKTAVISDTRCDPKKGCDVNQQRALWYSQENCESSCSNNPDCKFYLWREDSDAHAVKTCATFNNCGSTSAFNDGNGGCIYKKKE